jgi:hypothetical protein
VTTPHAVRDAFRRQARSCARLGSPLTARLCVLSADRLAPGTPVGDAVLLWRGDPRADALALRLAGALHALVLLRRDAHLAAAYPPRRASDAALWRAVEGALRRHARFVIRRLAHPPQTNETARAGALAAGLLTVAVRTRLPLAVWEIGASAGLNLLWHRFAYRFGGARWSNPAAPVRIAPDWQGPPPPLDPVTPAETAGCDIAPIDPRDREAVLRLASYVWPDQRARLARLRAALEMARAEAVAVEAADAADWLAMRLAVPRPGVTRVVMHSIMWQYLPAGTQARIRALIASAGEEADAAAPLAWLRLEPDGAGPGAAVSLSLWPGGRTERLGRADFHGRWVHWGA